MNDHVTPSSIRKHGFMVSYRDLEELIDSLDLRALAADEKARLYKLLQKKFLGVEIPHTVNQSLSLGGVQIVGGNINLNVLDAKVILEAVEKVIEKDPEFIVKLAEMIVKQSG